MLSVSAPFLTAQLSRLVTLSALFNEMPVNKLIEEKKYKFILDLKCLVKICMRAIIPYKILLLWKMRGNKFLI